MKVRVLTAKNGFKAGQIVDMDAPDAQHWMASGDGEKVDGKAGQASAETATAKGDAETR